MLTPRNSSTQLCSLRCYVNSSSDGEEDIRAQLKHCKWEDDQKKDTYSNNSPSLSENLIWYPRPRQGFFGSWQKYRTELSGHLFLKRENVWLSDPQNMRRERERGIVWIGIMGDSGYPGDRRWGTWTFLETPDGPWGGGGRSSHGLPLFPLQSFWIRIQKRPPH